MSDAIADNDYPLELAGETWRLEFTPRAMGKIAKHFGGFRQAHHKLDIDRDPEAMAAIIRLGSGCGDKDAKKVPELVFGEGAAMLVKPLRIYLYRLEGGGRTLEDINTTLMAQADNEESPEGN